MRCHNCGHEFSEGIFCPECGEKYDEKKALERDLIELERTELKKAESQASLFGQDVDLSSFQQEEKKDIRLEEVRRRERELRTFGGQVYDSIEEMEAAKIQSRADSNARVSLVLGIASVPLAFLCGLGIVAGGISLSHAIQALVGKTQRKKNVIVALCLDAISIVVSIVILWGILFGDDKIVIKENDVQSESVEQVGTELIDEEVDISSPEVSTTEKDIVPETEKNGDSVPTTSVTDETPTSDSLPIDTSICGIYEYQDYYWDDVTEEMEIGGYGRVEIYTQGNELYAYMYYMEDPMASNSYDEERRQKISPTGNKGEYITADNEVILTISDDTVSLEYNNAGGWMDYYVYEKYDY